MRQKQLFKTLFFLLTILLIMLPFLVSLDEYLTKVMEHFQAYMFLQNQIVPVEVRMVKIILSLLGIDFIAYPNGMSVGGTFLGMTWNCIGWQSILFLTITLFVGLKSGSYTLTSQLETVVIGILGTFFMNLFRLCLIVILFTLSRPLYAIVYHNYLSGIFTLIWLFFFWWFSYKFVLEESKPKIQKAHL